MHAAQNQILVLPRTSQHLFFYNESKSFFQRRTPPDNLLFHSSRWYREAKMSQLIVLIGSRPAKSTAGSGSRWRSPGRDRRQHSHSRTGFPGGDAGCPTSAHGAPRPSAESSLRRPETRDGKGGRCRSSTCFPNG